MENTITPEKVVFFLDRKTFIFDKSNIKELIFVSYCQIKYYENGKVAFEISAHKGDKKIKLIKEAIEEKMGVKVTIK